MTSATKNHNQSKITTAIYSTKKVTIGGLDHTDCDKMEVKTNEVSDTAALNDGQYISLLATIAQKQTDNLQYPLVSNKFLKKMITTHNQCALVPSAPVQLSHVTGKTQMTRTIPNTEMKLNHVLPAEVIIKTSIRSSLRTTFLVVLACHKLRNRVGKKLRLSAHSGPLCLSLLETAALQSMERLVSPDSEATSGKMTKQTKMADGLFGEQECQIRLNSGLHHTN